MCVAHSSALLNWRLLLSNDLLLKVAHRVAFLVVSLGVVLSTYSYLVAPSTSNYAYLLRTNATIIMDALATQDHKDNE